MQQDDGRSRMKRTARVTTSDIAKAVGLSRATVSYALNGKPGSGIPDSTVDRIKKAASDMGYVPSAAARLLRSGNSTLVLGILPSWDLGPTYPQIFAGMGDRLEQSGYEFVLQSGAETFARISGLLSSITPALVVSLPKLEPEITRHLSAAGILYHHTDLAAFIQLAARTQTEYMISCGYERLAYVIPAHPMPQALIAPRIDTMRQIIRKHGLPELRVLRLPYDEMGFREFQRNCLEGPETPNGLCAHTDEVAAYMFARMGREYFGSGRTGLIGIGDRPISNIGVTTVRLDIEKWANVWSAPLLKLLNNNMSPPRPYGEEMSVVRREST